MAEAVRALWTIWPTPAPAGTPRAGGPGLWPGGFWRSPRKRPHSLWAMCASAPALHSTAVLSGAQREPLCSCLCPWPLILALGTTEQSLVPSPLHHPLGNLHVLLRSLLFSVLNSPTSQFFLMEEVLQSLHHLHSPLSLEFHFFTLFLHYREVLHSPLKGSIFQPIFALALGVRFSLQEFLSNRDCLRFHVPALQVA